MSREVSPLAQTLRAKAEEIEQLLKEYEILRYGDEIWRFGDETWRKGKTEVRKVCPKCGRQYPLNSKEEKCELCDENLVKTEVRLGIPPHTAGQPPQITVSSSPRSIFYEEEAKTQNSNRKSKKGYKKAVNPVNFALVIMGELTNEDAHRMELEKRYGILSDLGVDERRNCVALIPWLRKLASILSYILETRTLYSSEIKAIYPELLTSIEIALSTCDQLAYLLGRQHGQLTARQYDELLVKLLHYTKIAQQAALQLADYHEEFIGAQATPFESPEAKFVLEMEEKEAKKFKEFPAEEEFEKPKD